ncbi:MAG: hypothetical protein ACLQU2_28535 [Candidatus Binataceae bacterium]
MSRSAEQLSQLVAQNQALSTRVTGASQAIDAVLAALKESLPQLASVAGDLRVVGVEMGRATIQVGNAAASMKATQEAIEKTAGHAEAQVQALSQAAAHIQDDMRLYQQAFNQIRASAGDVLTQIGLNLRSYTEVTRNGFEGIIKTFNDQMGTAVSGLNGSIGELDDYLQELNEMLERYLQRMNSIEVGLSKQIGVGSRGR